MSTNITLLFCEGKDEPPYLYRLLKSRQWSNWTDKKLQDYPKILGDYIRTEVKEFSSLADVDQWTNSKSILPSYILKKRGAEQSTERIICIWNLGGESRIDKAKECIEAFRSVVDSEFDEHDAGTINLSLLFFYDADKSVSDRLAMIKKSFTDILPDFCKSLTGNKAQRYEKVDGFPVCGLYIFSDEKFAGTVEDYLLPIMKAGDEKIFDAAQAYLDTHFDKGRSEKKFSMKKAVINIAGQLQKSGKSNHVIIKDCDYINNAKISGNKNIQDMIDFMESFC